MKAILNTARTVWQGEAIESGKDLEMYVSAAAICHLNKDQLMQLEIKSGDNVKVISDHGDVIVKAVETKETLPDGMIFIPMGPWANRVVNPHLDSTAMPSFKDTMVEIVPTNENVLDMPTLMKVYGKQNMLD